MRVNTIGTNTKLRDALREDVGRLDDDRRSVFIELRERGAESVIAKAEFSQEAAIRGRRKSHNIYAYATHFSPYASHGIQGGFKVNDLIEVFLNHKTGSLTAKPCKFVNVITPYRLIPHSPKNDSEVFLATASVSVVTNIELRRTFAESAYIIANKTKDPVHRISALKAMEQLFVSLTSAGKIDRTTAEKKYEIYLKLSEMIWRGTPGEQVNAFGRAWVIMAKATGIQQETNK